MPTMQIIFLFDLNAYTDIKCKVGLDLNKQLVCLRLSCLRILNHFSTLEPNLKWGFKFFDSCGSLTQTMCKFSFPSFSLESFETLETEITNRYQRYQSYLDALSSRRNYSTSLDISTNQLEENNKSFHPVQVLQLALTQIVCEYHWSSQLALFSPSKKKHLDEHMNKNDILFLVTKCPKNEIEFSEYFGSDINDLTFSKFSKILLSPSLHEQLLLKSSILWIWLNTNNNEFLGDCTDGNVSKLAKMLRNLKSALIPVSIFHHLPHAIKYEENPSTSLRMDFFNSLIPFSSIISQSVSFPFYIDSDNSYEKATFRVSDQEILVHVIKMSVPRKSDSLELHFKSDTQNMKKEYSRLSSAVLWLNWTKFVVCFALPKNSCPSSFNFLCLPRAASEGQNYEQFLNLNKTLILKNLSLFLECESTCGTKMVGLFSPVCDSSSLISVMSAKELFTSGMTHFSSSIVKEINCDTNSAINQTGYSSFGTNSEKSCMKPFQIECFEQWFEASSSICAIPVSSEQQKSNSSLKAFYKKLSLKLSKHQKSSPEKENIAPTDEIKENVSEPVSEVFDVSNISYQELIILLTSEYKLALEPGHPILYSAKRIAKSASSFFKMKSSGFPPAEEVFNNFMMEFFSVTIQTLNEKYESTQENEKRIQECQLQVLLMLETEILFPSPDRSSYVKKITSFLRCMSFYSSASLLNTFLYEVLKENYKDTLYDILVEIGDELDIPIFEDEDDSPSPSEPSSSNSMLGSNNSRMSSVFSVKSSSSSSSRADNRKPIKRRSDIMDNSKNRQFLLTKSSPKKRKYKNLCPGGENIPVRYSPRLSSKRKRDKNLKAQMNSGHVRRNLFPKDQKPMTPRYNRSPYGKRRAKTPKAHHVLKTNFVAETPTSKQNLSALGRRKSFMDTDDSEASLTEIAESPKIVKNAKDTVHREHLKRLNSLETNRLANHQTSSVQLEPQPVPSCSSYSQYTPESKRRLSLKLFSKLLTSPTARMGWKKCSKRLFDQVSPQVENKTSKKPKLDAELEKQTSKNHNNESDNEDNQKLSGTS